MKKIIRLTESDLVNIIKGIISEQPEGCDDPSKVLKEVPKSFADFINTVKSQKKACGSKCPTVKGSTAQDFADKYTEKKEYLWGGLDSLYEPDELYMFDSMGNEIINIILEKYNAPWRVNSKIKPSIVIHKLNESKRMYGHDDISKLYTTMGDDEDVELSDGSGELSGQVVKKIDYVKNMLGKAIENEDWDMVRRTISYLDIKF